MNSSLAISETIPGLQPRIAVRPGCEPFAIRNGHDSVVLFLHGLTGTPADFRRFSRCYGDDFDVVAPLLPGHATHISHLERLTYRELTIPLPPLMAYLEAQYARIHLVGLSYGAIPVCEYALAGRAHSLSLFAPAFFLRAKNERNMRWVRRLRLHWFRSRVPKSRIHPPKLGDRTAEETFAYTDIPVKPALALHKKASQIKAALAQSTLPLFYAHGDQDTTTPLAANRNFIMQARPDAVFHLVPEGQHVITLGPGATDLATTHRAWLKEHDA